MSRFRQFASIDKLANIHRAIRDAREAVDLERAQDVRAARDEARLVLNRHGCFMAALTLSFDVAGLSATREFQQMAQRMKDGGYHKTRILAGGSLDG